MKNLTIVNNTNADLRQFHDALVAVANGQPLHADLADLFTAERIECGDEVRVVVRWS